MRIRRSFKFLCRARAAVATLITNTRLPACGPQARALGCIYVCSRGGIPILASSLHEVSANSYGCTHDHTLLVGPSPFDSRIDL
ncbi:hypothetical protein BC629DRAFT_1537590, partial [Irpex lacteus]